MFIMNKYTKLYYLIIDKAIKENRKKIPFVYEQHHIIPRACGGCDKKSNLVLLIYKEHFLVHWLLPYMMESVKYQKKMWAALSWMRRPNNHNKCNASWRYVIMKKAIHMAQKGTPKSKSHKEALKKENTGKRFIYNIHDPFVVHQINPDKAHQMVTTGDWVYGMGEVGPKAGQRTIEQKQKQVSKQKETLRKKYGVENISQIPYVKKIKGEKVSKFRSSIKWITNGLISKQHNPCLPLPAGFVFGRGRCVWLEGDNNPSKRMDVREKIRQRALERS